MSYALNGFASEEEEILSVRLNSLGSTDISVSRFVASQQVSEDGFNSTVAFVDSTTILSNRRGSSSPSASFRRHRPLPPLNPLTLLNPSKSISNMTPSAEPEPLQPVPVAPTTSTDSPFLRRLDSFRRSSTEFSISSFRQNYVNSTNSAGNSGASNQNPDFDSDLGTDPSLDPLAVRQSSSSESQAFYGNEDVVKELKPEYARWFYKYEADRTWTPFTGYDTIRMEHRYRILMLEREATYGNDTLGGREGYDYSTPPAESTNNGYFYNNDQHHHQKNHHHQHPYNDQYYNNEYLDDNHHLYQGQINECADALSQHPNQHQYEAHANNPYYDNYYAPQEPHPQQNDTHFAPIPSSRFHNQYHHYASTGSEQAVGATSSANNMENNEETTKKQSGEETFGENVIIVRGGLYEADVETWNCVATYWPGDKCQILRGTWFYDGTWQPLNVEHAERLEEEHLGQFSGVALSVFNKFDVTEADSPTKKNRPVVHRVSFCEFHVDWTSPTEIHLYSKAASYKFMRSVGQRLGFQTWGHRVCRGYFKPASMEDRPSEISHLVFVVHGIGQKMDTGRIVRNCASFRDTVSSLKEKFYPHLNETKQRAEFFPVEWRSAAKLDGDVVDAITPHKVLSLRQILNSTAMDIMYYTSPLYRTEIQNALRNELNRIYSNFVKRNPDFKKRGGKVSIVAHSLGAVIAYDIITGYMPQSPDIPQYAQQNASGVPFANGHAKDSIPGLLFQLEHFFCLGSPLSVFLALRWREPHNPSYRSYILPNLLCKRIYNVFFSTDPVAYRLEPLLNKHYVQITPLPVCAYGVLGRPKYDEMPREKISKEINFMRQPESSTLGTNPSQNGNGYSCQQESAKTTPQRTMNLKSPPTPTRGQESNWGWASLMKYLKSDPLSDGDLGADLLSPDGNSSSEEGNTTPEDIEIPNDLDYRMDYVLKESNFSSTYLAALTSHTSYWSSPDTAYFVLTHLYGDLLDLPQSQAQ